MTSEDPSQFEFRVQQLLEAGDYSRKVRSEVKKELEDIRKNDRNPELRRNLENHIAFLLVHDTNRTYQELGLPVNVTWDGFPVNDPMVQPLPQETHFPTSPLALAGGIIAAIVVVVLVLGIASGNGSNGTTVAKPTATFSGSVVGASNKFNTPTATPTVAVPLVVSTVAPAVPPIVPQEPPTDTPYPTKTPIPPTPTRTSIPPTPTITPYPNTADNAILGLGDRWTYGGVTLTLLDKPEWNYGNGKVDCSADMVTLRLKFNVANHSSEPLVFRFDQTNFNITLSNGEKMKWVSGGKMIQLDPGQSTTWHDIYNPEHLDITISLCGDYLQSGVTYIQVAAVNFSRIPHAVWRIPVNN